MLALPVEFNRVVTPDTLRAPVKSLVLDTLREVVLIFVTRA